MCKLNIIKDKAFYVYYMPNENYVGVTTNLHKRILKHKNKSRYNTDNTIVLCSFLNLKEALDFEFKMQNFYKCEKGVRNQVGHKNPLAKTCLHLTTGLYFDTIKDACEALGFSYSLVRHRIKNSNNKFNLIRL